MSPKIFGARVPGIHQKFFAMRATIRICGIVLFVADGHHYRKSHNEHRTNTTELPEICGKD
jgi:hypothetical protein